MMDESSPAQASPLPPLQDPGSSPIRRATKPRGTRTPGMGRADNEMRCDGRLYSYTCNSDSPRHGHARAVVADGHRQRVEGGSWIRDLIPHACMYVGMSLYGGYKLQRGDFFYVVSGPPCISQRSAVG